MYIFAYILSNNLLFLQIQKLNFAIVKDKIRTYLKSKPYKFYIRLFWIVFATPLIAFALLLVLISSGYLGYMPKFRDLENPKSNLASEIFSVDGQVLGKYYKENRTVVSYEDLSPNLVHALISIEDTRFYEHSGIDGRSLFRVLVKTLMLGKKAGGGSTITQQLAKNIFPRDTTNHGNFIKRGFKLGITKFKEWLVAIKLERNYTKEEILAMYLTTVPFGSGSFGIKSAARTYFNTTPDSLNVEQAALLIGILNAPTYYSPLPPVNAQDSMRLKRRARSIVRRNTVLAQMEKSHYITQHQYDSISKLDIQLSQHIETHNKGLSTYFREYLRMAMQASKPDRDDYSSNPQQYKEDSLAWENDPVYGWCNKNLKPDGTSYDLYKDGLRIYTTINSHMQKYAEDAVAEHLGKFIQPNFEKEHPRKNKRAPFSWQLNEKQIQDIMTTTMRRSERYIMMKRAGFSEKEIKETFMEPIDMKVFSWHGDIDTNMTPWDSLRYYKFFLNAGMMSMEPQTGYVRAYVGGIDYEYFKFDHVKKSKRQVGSTFKPFLYTLAMMDENIHTPCYKVPNVPVTIEMPDGQPPYTPAYSENKHEGEMITLKYGLANSLNQVSAWLMKHYGPKAVVDIARSMGVTSPLEPVPSLCVGAAEVTLAEMIAAYDTYTNKGVYVEPIFVQHIEDKNGNVIATFKAKKKEAISEETAYLMINLLQGVVDFGTSVRLRYRYNFKADIAAKTGTTNNNSDGWFIGLTPHLVSGAWVGGEERSIHFYGTDAGQGAAVALPIWALYMKKVWEDKSLGISPDLKFERPSNGTFILDCGNYDKESLDENKELIKKQNTEDDFF